MKVYRLEMLDGSGSFFSPRGAQRRTVVELLPVDFDCSCSALEKLNVYFYKCSNLLQEYKLIIKEITGQDIILPGSLRR